MLKKKYKFSFNPKIINYDIVPNSNWSIYDTYKKTDTKHTIFLNYPEKLFFRFDRKDNKFFTNKKIQHSNGISSIVFNLKDEQIKIIYKIKELVNKELGVEISSFGAPFNKYNADIFVFLNQFELKKFFAKGENIAYNNYGRDVLVHYSVIDKTGKLLYGNAATYNIEAKYDNINEIINMTFPHISTEMFSHLPGSQQSEELQKLDKRHQKKAENKDILRKN